MGENPATPGRRDAGTVAPTVGPWQPDVAEMEEVVRKLEAIYRPSATEGERDAAEWIAWRLRERGCPVMVEEELAHGTYWWPVGLMSAAAVVAGMLALRGRRVIGTLVGALAAIGIVDDIDSGPQVFRHRFLPYHPSWNVVAEAGDA